MSVVFKSGCGMGTRATVCRRIAAGLVGAAALLTSSVSVAQEVKLNEVLRSLFYAPQYVAMKIGAFEQEGLNIIGPKTTWGTQATITEIVSGGSNIALLGPEAAAMTQAADPSRRLINFARLTNRDGSFIIGKKPMPDFRIADLKGKTIVTGGAGSTPYLVLASLIQQAGMDLKRDVNIRAIPISANIIPSFLEGGADFAQAFEPAVAKAISEAGAHRVASIGVLAGEMPYTAYATTVSYMEKNPKVIQGFANGIQKGLTWTKNHSAKEVAEAIAPYFKDLPLATIETVIAEYKKADVWPDDISLPEKGINQMIDLLVRGGALKERVAYEEIVNPSFAAKAGK